MTQTHTFLFHDYETWGTDPRKDYPCQFAAIRTDENLEPIGEPIEFMCQIPNDYLPHPGACLVTGITPQLSLKRGYSEAEFANKINQIMSVPNTCSVGYNSIRFDDEVSRFLFFRNFFDPYEREWKNGNSRWDIIDLTRACHALRPDGLEWAYKDDGTPSFKLEHLTAANNIEHSGAHDALADVRATIALAKQIKQAQPKLFEYGLSLKNKQVVRSQINLDTLTPLLHISSKIPAAQGCCTWILPIAQHPSQPNAIICIDLSKDIASILNDSVEELKRKLYAKTEELGDNALRPGIKLIHINKSPFITSAKALSEERAKQIGLDRETCLRNYKALAANTECFGKLITLYEETAEKQDIDAEYSLYSGGFLSAEDKRWCKDVRYANEEQLAMFVDKTHSEVLKRLLYLYRGRNYPHTLSHDEMLDWQRHRELRLREGTAGLSIERFITEIEGLGNSHQNQPKQLAILKSLYQYAQNL